MPLKKINDKDKKLIFNYLNETMNLYYPLSKKTQNELLEICTIRYVSNQEYAFDIYDNVEHFTFVYRGLLRAFSNNEKAEEYNISFFNEGRFFGPMSSLLLKSPVQSAVQALEDSILVDIHFESYRKLLFELEDLKLFQILYLEKHWIIEKKDNEYSLVLEDARLRYKRFLKQYKHIITRLSLYHIALFLGISPTHLSRIRKELKTNCV